MAIRSRSDGAERRAAIYSESDIDGAVLAGVLAPDAAHAFRDHVARSRSAPAVDEESFRLLTGFNDIFVSIAILLTLAAVGWIATDIASTLSGAAVAAAAWGLSEYFTRQRRMALPSIILLIAFVGGVAATPSILVINNSDAIHAWTRATIHAERGEQIVGSLIAAAIAALTATSAWLHWRRFMVPITIAAGALAVVGVLLALIFGLVPAARGAALWIVLLAGLGMFAFAMRWDVSDRERRTRRSDVAFWLHLAAAPMIAHALFHLIGVFSGELDLAKAFAVLALYVAFTLVALAVDRRALLVSSLIYVLYAMYAVFKQAGAVELSAALTSLVIGSALLTMSAFWQSLRARIVPRLGGMADRLPPTVRGLA